MTGNWDRTRAERHADRVASAVTAPPETLGRVDSGPASVPPSPVPRHVYDAVASPGRAVDPPTAARFGAIGHDIAHVRIHSDPVGDTSARRLGALAYTFGHDVVIRTDQQYRPALVAHELAHVTQQSRGPAVLQLQDDPEVTTPPEAADDDLVPPAAAPEDATHTAPATAADGDAGTTAGAADGLTGVDAGTTPTAPDTASTTPQSAATTPETTTTTPQDAVTAPAPTAITASVGRHGVNAAADVALIQDRLLALGVLSADDVSRERPVPPDAGTDAGALPSIPEDRMPATIAAILTFQRPLGLTDGNVGPNGPTWRALMNLDAAGYAASVQAWQEREQRRAATTGTTGTPPAPAPRSRSQVAADLLNKYGSGVGGDAAGLGADLAGRAVTDPELVPVVLDGVSWWKRDDVAYETTRKLTDEQLAALPSTVAERLAAELAGGWRTAEEQAQLARLHPAGAPSTKAAEAAEKTPGDAAARARDATGTMASPVLDGVTFDQRVAQIRAFYDTYWVPRASTGNCHEAAKAALEKMGYSVGGGDTAQFPTPIGDTALTVEQNDALKKAILDEIQAGRPVEIGVDYTAGHPGNVDHKTDHWLYAVAVTHDDSGALVLVAYDNADVAKSTITKGQVVFFRLDEMGRFQHPAYFPTTSTNLFSTKPHIIVNARPTIAPPAN